MKKLLKNLIRAESTPRKGELAAAQVISAEFGQSAIEPRIDGWGQNRANIIAHIKSAGPKPALLFACHLDVVEPGEAAWRFPPFEAVESDGRVYGRGSTDMKGGLAAAVTAIRRIVDSGTELEGDIIFLAVAGEETDSCGARRFIGDPGRLGELAPKGLAGVVIPEPTDFAAVTAHRGMLWLQVTTKGKAAHGSAPQLGVNAIASMQLVLNELDNYEVCAESHELLGRCSMSINTITAGKELNVVPDKCTIGVDIRTLRARNHQDIPADFERMLAKLKADNPRFDGEVSVLREVQPLETDSRCDFVRDFCAAVETGDTRAVGFTTDGPFFASLGAPVVIFGPGEGKLCHRPDEYIDIADVEKAAEHYRNIILKFLA